MSHYSIKCSSFIWLKYHYFPVKYASTLISLSCLHTSLRIPSQKKLGSIFATNHTEPFLLHHCFEISNLPSAALTRGQMAQKFPVKLLHQFACLTSAVWVTLGCWKITPHTSCSSEVRLSPWYCSLLYQL